MSTKQCGDCDKVKPVSDFFKRADGSAGSRSICKLCSWNRSNARIKRIRAERRPTRMHRFIQKIEFPDGCWVWKGSLHRQGYGMFRNESSPLAHRYAYLLFRGKVPEGLVLDHLCRNSKCVNPFHLEIVTQTENIRRGNAPAGKAMRRKEKIK
jgi:hypothetical protein